MPQVQLAELADLRRAKWLVLIPAECAYDCRTRPPMAERGLAVPAHVHYPDRL